MGEQVGGIARDLRRLAHRPLPEHPLADHLLPHLGQPLGALDALTREKMQGLVLRLWKETGKTIVLITHSVEEALFLGERLIVMAPRPGRVIRDMALPFAEMALRTEARTVKASADFVQVREEVLSMIWSMEEEIMGGAQDGT